MKQSAIQREGVRGLKLFLLIDVSGCKPFISSQHHRQCLDAKTSSATYYTRWAKTPNHSKFALLHTNAVLLKLLHTAY